MKILFLIIIFFNLIFQTGAVEVNCKSLENKAEKLSCLAKLKAKSIGQGAKQKISPIDKKFKETHKKISNKTTETEKKIFKSFKDTKNKISENKYIKKALEKNREINEKTKSKN